MTEPRTPCPRSEQAVGWALHSLEPDEELAVLRHLPQCADCRAAVHDAEAVLSQLGTAVEQVDPPARLRERILAAAADTPQVRTPSTAEPITAPAQRREMPSESPVAPTRQRRPSGRGWLTRGGLVAAAASLVAVIAIGGLAIRTVQLQNERDTIAARAQSLNELVQHLDQPHAVLAQQDGTTAAVVILPSGQPTVYAVGLPANAANHTYVLWGLTGGTPSALGAFDVRPADRGAQPVGAPTPATFEAYAISLEPGRTAPATPTDVVASGPLVA